MRSGKAKFKQLRHFATLAILPALLLGCASVPRPGATGQSRPPMSASVPDARTEGLVKKAQSALDRGDMQAAQADYARAAMRSGNPDIAARATGLALALHDSDAAEKALARWKALGADPEDVLRARARIALDQGRTDQARALLMKLTAGGGKPAWQAFGKIILNARDAAQAGQLLQQVATPARLPDDVLAWLAMSEIGQKLGRYAYAQQIADTAAERFRDGRAYAWAGSLEAQRGNDKAAQAMYARAVKVLPDNIDLRMAYAGLVAKQGHLAEAGRILARGRQDERTFAARTAFAARNKDMKSLGSIYESLTRAPGSVRKKSYYLLGQLAALLDKPQAAVDWLAKVPPRAEHGVDAGIRRAVLLQQLGHPGQAHGVLQNMRTVFADQPQIAYRLDRVDAELYMQAGDYARAATAYTRAMAGNADSGELLYGRGLAYAEDGKTAAAVADLRAVLRLEPDNINAVNALGYTLADAGRNLSEARKLLERAHKAKPDDPAITDSWGWLQFRLGHLARAEKALRWSWKQRKDSEVGAHLAQVLLVQGKRSEARRIYREALKLAPHNRHLLALRAKFGP